MANRWPSHYCLTVWCDTGNSPRLARSASERIVGADYDLVLRTLRVRWPSHYCLTVWCDTGNSPRLARSASERIVGADYDLVLRTLRVYDKGYCATNVCFQSLAKPLLFDGEMRSGPEETFIFSWYCVRSVLHGCGHFNRAGSDKSRWKPAHPIIPVIPAVVGPKGAALRPQNWFHFQTNRYVCTKFKFLQPYCTDDWTDKAAVLRTVGSELTLVRDAVLVSYSAFSIKRIN
ncbi:hypothetical protein J6590_001974 [Homalodisca vitripennis]|nr:hypothetical protein J6590_001974 [Homalodisca vitripennis]